MATFPSSLLMPTLMVAALAGLAFFLKQKKSSIARHVEVLESTSLGPKRALVVARLGNETLVLGSSEAGITLLATRPYLAPMPAAAPTPEALGIVTPLTRMKSLFSAKKAAPAPSFDTLLEDENAEHEELRRKLAQGRGGRVS